MGVYGSSLRLDGERKMCRQNSRPTVVLYTTPWTVNKPTPNEIMVSSANSLNRFSILGTVCMTSSHLNVILQFLSDCDILRFTPSLRSEQNGTAPIKLLAVVLPVTTLPMRNGEIWLVMINAMTSYVLTFAAFLKVDNHIMWRMTWAAQRVRAWWKLTCTRRLMGQTSLSAFGAHIVLVVVVVGVLEGVDSIWVYDCRLIIPTIDHTLTEELICVQSCSFLC